MNYRTPGHFRSAKDFRAHLNSIDPHLDCVLETRGTAGPLGLSARIGTNGKRIGNRFAIQPMEGWDASPDGLPTEALLRRWKHFGRSGAKLIWGGEAFAVQEDGRANPNQLYLNPNENIAGALDTLRNAILAGHDEIGESSDDLVVGLQLTHSGRYSRPDGNPAPLRAYVHPAFDAGVSNPPILTDAELEGIAENYVRTAKLAHEAGFDFVDVKCCHGYLLHELLSARSREGSYGGSLDNRLRLPCRIVEAIRAECPGLEVGVRLSTSDTVPHAPNPKTRVGEPTVGLEQLPYTTGFGVDENDPLQHDLTEPFAFIEKLTALGVRLFNVTLGSPYSCYHIQRPAAYPPSDGYIPPEDPLVSVARHLEITRRVKAAFPDLLVMGTGYTYLQEWLVHVAEHEVESGHVDFVGLGRMVLSYPDLPRDALAGKTMARKRICRTFSDCTTAPRNGMRSGCYPLDPYYKGTPDAARLKAIKQALASDAKKIAP